MPGDTATYLKDRLTYPWDAATNGHPQQPRILVEPHRRARPRGRVARRASSILLGGIVLLVLATVAGMALGAWRFTVIDTGSMRPTLNPGDVAVLTSERLADLREGQIIAFHPPGKPRLTVIHRVFSLRHVRGGVVIQTKGDANNIPDRWHARVLGPTVWRESLKVPGVGYLAAWSQRPLIRFGLLSIVVVLAVSMLLGEIWRPARR